MNFRDKLKAVFKTNKGLRLLITKLDIEGILGMFIPSLAKNQSEYFYVHVPI